VARLIICTDCGDEKPHAGRGRCQQCRNRHYYETHREEILARQKDWYKKNRKEALLRMRRWGENNRDKKAANHRRWQRENRDKVNATNRRWQRDNREKATARVRRWRRENPERATATRARRRAREQMLPDTLTPEQARQLIDIGRTIYPEEELHLDHIVPVSRGGGTTFANMRAIPASLNCSKQDALPEEVYRQEELWQGFCM